MSLWFNKNTKTQKHKEEKMQREAISDEMNQVSKQIVDAAFTVNSALGAGLLESVFDTLRSEDTLDSADRISLI